MDMVDMGISLLGHSLQGRQQCCGVAVYIDCVQLDTQGSVHLLLAGHNLIFPSLSSLFPWNKFLI